MLRMVSISRGSEAKLTAVPVHLGSMQYAVKGQAELHKGQLRPGDVLVSNHPKSEHLAA